MYASAWCRTGDALLEPAEAPSALQKHDLGIDLRGLVRDWDLDWLDPESFVCTGPRSWPTWPWKFCH